jgi:hypothetical protein
VKYLPLIWSGIWRNPGRTLLIFLQISVAFALFGVLEGMKTGVDEALSKARGDLPRARLRVRRYYRIHTVSCRNWFY